MTYRLGQRRWPLDNLARRVVYVWAATLGLEVGQRLIPNFRVAIGDVLLVLAGLLLLAGGAWRQRLRSLPWGPLAAISMLGLAIAFGLMVDLWRYGFIIREAWFNKGIGVVLLISIVFVVGSTIRYMDHVITLMRAYLAGAIASTIFAFLLWTAYWLGLAPVGLAPFGVRFVGFLLSPNAAAIYFSICLVLSLGAAARAPYVVGSWKLWAGVSVLFLASLLLSLSRSTWVAMFVASLFFIFRLPRRRLLPVGSAIVLLLLLTPALQAAVAPTLEQLLGGGTVSFLRRDEGTGGLSASSSPTPTLSATRGAIPSLSASIAASPTPTPTATATPTLTATPTVAPTTTPLLVAVPTVLPTSPPEPSSVTPRDQNVGYFQNAGDVASDRYGFNDRIVIDVVALRLWRHDASTLSTGLGLEGFPLLALSTELGEPVDIHSTYVWLPVEMGLPGIVALITILCVIGVTSRHLILNAPREISAPVVGVLALYLTWWTMNEGLYQRSFWLFLCLAAVIAGTTPRRRREGSWT